MKTHELLITPDLGEALSSHLEVNSFVSNYNFPQPSINLDGQILTTSLWRLREVYDVEWIFMNNNLINGSI